MSTPNPPPGIEGIPGTEAGASKRGYYYQDVVTALAWVGLRAGQSLHIEIAEDKAVCDTVGAEITQIRDVAGSLTLVRAVDYLERVVDLMRKNPDTELRFVYHTTAKIAEERSLRDRPNGEKGLDYWERVRNGADPKPLIDVLRRLAAKNGSLAAFLAQRDDRTVVQELISRVTWATNMPRVAKLEAELADRVAEFANHELGLPWADGSELAALVIKEITTSSFSQELDGRTLNRSQLVRLLKSIKFETIPVLEYRRISRDAAIAKNTSIEPLDREVERRLAVLRQSRTLRADATAQARALADDVREGGPYELCTPSLRASVLGWCARILLEADAALAKALLLEANSLGSELHVKLVEALLRGRDDPDAALNQLAEEINPTAQTIRYLISRRQSRDAALKRVHAGSLRPMDFDEDGMFFVLIDMLQESEWMAALDWAEDVPEEALDRYPPLLWGIALALVASCVPEPATHAALEGPPLIRELRLRSDLRDIAARRRAAGLFRRFYELSRQIGIEEQGDAALEYALWLELKDRKSRNAATAEILQYWANSDEGLRWMPLALLARVSIQKGEKLERILALAQKKYGALSYVDARALMALIMSMPVGEWLNQWNTISDLVRPHFTKEFVQFFEIEALLRAERFDDAREALTKAKELAAEPRALLESEIESATNSTRSLQMLRDAASGTDRYPEACRLIDALAETGEFDEAIERAEALYKETRDLSDAEQWFNLLVKVNRWSEIETYLDANSLLVEQSHTLAGHYLISLTRHGRWGAAKQLVDRQPEIIANKAYFDRTAAILSGNWEALHPMLEAALANTGLKAEELLEFAVLATSLDRIPAAKRLATDAVAQRPDDPTILWSAYMLAVRGKWEGEAFVGDWMRRAVDSSGEDGPVQKKSLSDLKDFLLQGSERNRTVAEHVAKGDLFMGMVAEMFGRSLSSIILEVAESNQSQRDFRKLSPICAFAGVERPREESIPQEVALDQTAILTLGNLRLLQKTGELFQRTWVPYSTFGWLFGELQDAKYHQPSRVYDANNLLRLLEQQIKVAQLWPDVSRPLARELGSSLAQLFRAAEVDREQGREAFVIRSAPIHRVNSWGDEDADVSAQAATLRSTLEVVRSLKFHEMLIDSRAELCEAFLQGHDRGWPWDELIPQGATLYLDSVAISYFHHLNLWDDALRAYTLVIHPEDRAEAAALARTESASENVELVLEDIRQFFLSGMETGKVQFLWQMNREQETINNRDKPRFLFLESVQRQRGVEAIIVDDRAGNKYPQFSYPEGDVVRIGTSLDILRWLYEKGMVSERDWFGYRNVLRRSGYVFIPIEERELLLALENATVRDGVILEPAGARAIRENLLLAQASGLLQIPNESAWLTNIGAVVMRALTAIWAENEDDLAIAKANWLVDLSRWDGFSGRMLGEWTEGRITTLDALALARLVYNGLIPEKRTTAYKNWLEERYVEPLKQARPSLFDVLCQYAIRQLRDIPSLIADRGAGYSVDDTAGMTAIYCRRFISDMPASIREKVLDDSELLKQLGLSRSLGFIAQVEGDPAFDTGAVFEAAHQALASKMDVHVKDRSGEIWTLSCEPTSNAVICSHLASGRSFHLLHGQLASPDPEERVSYLRGLARQYDLDESQVAQWIEVVRIAPIEAAFLSKMEHDFQASPVGMEAKLRDIFANGSADISDLVPVVDRYYERLVVPHEGATTLWDYAASLQAREEIPVVFGRIRYELLRSIHSGLVPAHAIGVLSPEALKALCKELIPEIDLWSLTGLIEAVAGYKELSDEVLGVFRALIAKFVELTDRTSERLRLTTALGSLVDGSLTQTGLFASAPVFWRRLASFAHAALIERCIVSLGLPVADLADWAEQRSPQFQVATLADLQKEPRWDALMFSPAHLYQELLGRIIFALEARRKELPLDLETAVFGDDPQSLLSKRELMISGLPGPLEGGRQLFQKGDEEFERSMEALLEDEKSLLHVKIVTVAHLTCLVEMPQRLLDQLTAAVEELIVSGGSVGDSGWTPFLSRLSLAATSSGHAGLAGAVMKLIREREEIPFATRVYMGVVTCGAQADEASWLDAVAEHLSYCSRLDLTRLDADYLRSVLQILSRVKPLLRPKVAEVGARLRGFVMTAGRSA